MKKITLLFMMLLSITAFSQIEVIENFDDVANNQVPTGWTETNFGASSNYTCDGSAKAMASPFTSAGQETLTTPYYTGISNGTDLTVSFSYNIFEQFSQFPPPSLVAPATNWGSIVLEYTTDGTNWNTITTIDDSNYTFVSPTDCSSTANINVGTIANGSDFQARFVVTVANITNFALWVNIDNVSFTQVATTTPNCDATLISPVNGSNTADSDVTLMWQAATGLPTGYTINVGTTTGGTDIVNGATTTETNYPLTGLNYETEYFVNIIPTNGVGSANGCTEESFTTRTAPIPGATCSSPIVISSFPFIEAGGDTDNYEDNIDTSPCSNSYMSGKDVFYEITPTTDVSINIELANISNNGASIHVVNGCPDAATECVDYVGSYSGTTRSLSEVVLLAGNTYFVVLSNSGSTRTYTYDLIITANSCINPTLGTLTPVADCSNGQFSVDVNIDYLGSATSLTLSDDNGTTSDITNITSTGTVTMGPYPSGATVNFTLTNEQDGTCSDTGSTYFYCPPTNDECSAPINLTVNTDDSCTIFTSATNAGATESVADPDTCASASNNHNDVWFTFTASSEVIILEYLNITDAINSGGSIQATELLEGSCGALTSIACYTSNYVTFSGLTIGNTYYIRNNTRLNGEFAQNYDICLREAPAPPANDECTNAAVLTASTDDMCNNAVSGTTVGATISSDNSCNTDGYGDVWYVFNPTVSGIYEFSLERLSTTPSTYYSVYEGSCGALTEVTTSCNSNSNQILTLDSTSTYYVMVQTSQVGEGIGFNLCVWQLPDAVVNSDCTGAIELTESSDINDTEGNSISSNLENAYYSPQGCSSSSYESVWYTLTPEYTGTYHFEFTRVTGSAYYTIYDTGNCASVQENYVNGISSCYNSAYKPIDVVAGNTYLILVHASSAAEFEFFVYPDATLGMENSNFESFRLYPNPVNDVLNLESQEVINSVAIYNIMGQQVQYAKPEVSDAEINISDLKSGVYFIKVSINNKEKTFKILKN